MDYYLRIRTLQIRASSDHLLSSSDLRYLSQSNIESSSLQFRPPCDWYKEARHLIILDCSWVCLHSLYRSSATLTYLCRSPVMAYPYNCGYDNPVLAFNILLSEQRCINGVPTSLLRVHSLTALTHANTLLPRFDEAAVLPLGHVRT